MAIILIGKIKIKKGPEVSLPGSPTSLSPILYNQGLLIGEPTLTTDTARMFIGHSPNIGNVNYNRTTLPYQNIEVLTESSPTIALLFSQSILDQNRNDFYVPTLITGSYNGPITYSDYSNTLTVPSRLDGNVISSNISYHAFYIANATTFIPTKSGTLQILGTVNSVVIQDIGTSLGVNSLTFSVGSLQQDKSGPFYTLNVLNNTSNSINLFLRKINLYF